MGKYIMLPELLGRHLIYETAAEGIEPEKGTEPFNQRLVQRGWYAFCKSELEQIKKLKIEVMKVDDSGQNLLAGIKYLTNLEKLDIYSEQELQHTIEPSLLDSISDEDIRQIAQLSNLKSLRIKNQGGVSQIDLSNLRDLEELDISQNITLENVKGLSQLSKIKRLDLWGNEWLTKCPELSDFIRRVSPRAELNLDLGLMLEALGYNYQTHKVNPANLTKILDMSGTPIEIYSNLNETSKNNGPKKAGQKQSHVDHSKESTKTNFDKAELEDGKIPNDKITWIEQAFHTGMDEVVDTIHTSTSDMLKILEKLQQVNEHIPINAKEMDKLYEFEKYLCKNVRYDYSEEEKRGIQSNSATKALLDGSSVCEGMSRALVLLLRSAGIDSRNVICDPTDTKYKFEEMRQTHSVVKVTGLNARPIVDITALVGTYQKIRSEKAGSNAWLEQHTYTNLSQIMGMYQMSWVEVRDSILNSPDGRAVLTGFKEEISRHDPEDNAFLHTYNKFAQDVGKEKKKQEEAKSKKYKDYEQDYGGR